MLRSTGARIQYVYRNVVNGASFTMPSNVVGALELNPAFTNVQADVPMYASSVTPIAVQPNPTWGLDRIDQHSLPLDGKFSPLSAGKGVTAYVVDTGIARANAEFKGRIRGGFSSVPGGTEDCNGHGTHVSGTIGGSTFGVARAVTLVPVRVLDCNGHGSATGVIAGLDWVVGNHKAGEPAVLNMSLGGGVSAALDKAVKRVVADGVTVVVAAGNTNSDACLSSPSRVPTAITVGATQRTDQRASFSNWGTCVDMFAPGVNITSAWVGGSKSTNTISGTSMATPHVTGAAAVVLSVHPQMKPLDVASTLLSMATTGAVTDVGQGSPNTLLYVGSK
jgi:subtilisin family serine protease